MVVNSQILNTSPQQKSDCMKARNDLITKRRTLPEIIDNFVPLVIPVVAAPKVEEVAVVVAPEVHTAVVTGATGRPKPKKKARA